MTTENIKYLLTGEDNATSVFNKVKQAIDNNDKSVGAFAKSVKEGGEVTQQLSAALGSLPLGPVAQQAAMAADQFSKLYEMKKLGAAGSLAFKAGLVGIVGVLAFQLGKALGDAIWQTKKWADEMEHAKKVLDELGSKMLSIAQGQHSERMGNIQLIRDPEKQRAALDAYLKQINMNIEGVNGLATRTAAARKEIAEMEAAWFKSGDFKAEIEVKKQLLAEDEKRFEMLKANRNEVEKLTNAEQKAYLAEVEAIKADNARLDALDALGTAYENEISKLELGDREYERRQALLNAVTAEEKAHIEALVEKKFALLDEQEAAKQAAEQQKQLAAEQKRAAEEAAKLAQKTAEEQERARTRQIELEDNYLGSLEVQLRALKHGKIAGDELKASFAGVSDETIKAGRAITDQIQAIEKANEAKKKAETERIDAAKKLAAFDTAAGSMSATESRLLNRGAGMSNEKQIADNTKKMVEQSEKVKQSLAEHTRILNEILRSKTLVLGAA